MFDDPREAIQTMIESHISERVNTNIPAKIISYDAANNRAVVMPTLPKRLDNDEPLEPSKIVEVPIVWPASGGGNASFTMPLKPGDGVMLAVQQRSIEGWLSGKETMPDDPRQFDLTDSVAIAGCSPGGTVAHPDNVVLKFGKANLTLMPDGMIVFGNDKGNITIDANGNMTLHAQTIQIQTSARNFQLETHSHKNTQPGSGNSGVPNP
jgi:hypothetical protein